MDILFELDEQEEQLPFHVGYVGMAEGVPVGHAVLFCRGEEVPELCFIWLEDKENGKLTLREFAEAFFQYLKGQGYTELWMRSEDPDSGDRLGFRLEDRDNSGWYPKYFFRREL